MVTIAATAWTAACNRSDDAGGGAPPADSPVAEAPDELDVDLEEADAALDRALALIPTMDAQVLVDAYLLAVRDVDEDCPNYTEAESGNHFWDGACETAAGARYHGAAFYYNFTNVDMGTEGIDLEGLIEVFPASLLEPGTLVTGQGFFGQIEAYNTTGDSLLCSCRGIAFVGESADGLRTWFNHTYGPITWSGAGAEETWLGSDQRAHLSQVATRTARDGALRREISGIVNGLADPYTTLEFEVEIRSDACTIEPVGTVKVRDQATGYWFEVAYDVTDTSAATDAACDGCGTATLYGTELGTVCSDYSALATWTTDPF